MCETASSPVTSANVDAVPMVDIVHRSPSSGNVLQTPVRDDAEGRRLTPDESSPAADDPAAGAATGAKHSKWGKLRQTVKATNVFASTVSGADGAGPGPASTRGSRRKLDSQADDRRESFLKRFSTRQSSYGTSYFQAASTDGTLTSNSNLEPDGKVNQQIIQSYMLFPIVAIKNLTSKFPLVMEIIMKHCWESFYWVTL